MRKAAGDKHTCALDWEPGKITFGIDGHTSGSVSDNVGADFAHGGVNEVSYPPSDHLWA